MGQLMDKAEAAHYLKVTVRHLQRLMSEGRVAHLRVPGQKGNVVRFDVDELERFAEARDAQVYFPKSDISSQRKTSQNVSLARNGDLMSEAVQAFGEAIAKANAEVTALLGETIAKAGRETIDQLRSSKPQPTVLELAAKAWLTRREALKLSGLPPKVLNEGLRSRRLGVKFGGRWLIRRTELERFATQWKPPRYGAK